MSRPDREIEPARGILPNIGAAILIALILFITWYLMGRNQHSIEILLPFP